MTDPVFKTSEECRLDLVSFSISNQSLDYIDLSMACDDMDFAPCSAARVSFGNEDKTGEDEAKDIKLMDYLAEHQHMTPFEYQHATFLIECPLFVRSQIHRHRAFSYNEISRRYTSEDLGFWIPTNWRGQSTSNRQASSDEIIAFLPPSPSYDDPLGRELIDPTELYKSEMFIALNRYNMFVEGGIAREQARALLPQSLLTKFYMGGNLRSWAHFIELRRDEHAQKEIQIIAERVADKLRELWPNSCHALGI